MASAVLMPPKVRRVHCWASRPHAAVSVSLLLRYGNGGIIHWPLETVTAEDVDIAVRALLNVLLHFENDAQ